MNDLSGHPLGHRMTIEKDDFYRREHLWQVEFVTPGRNASGAVKQQMQQWKYDRPAE